jgi:activator of HSP90 ATPase
MAKRNTAPARTKKQAAEPTATKGKRVAFDIETWQALDVLARERMMTFQEVADEAFRDLLKKHGRPLDVRDALKKSARAAKAEQAESEKQRPEKQKPAGNRRARSK